MLWVSMLGDRNRAPPLPVVVPVTVDLSHDSFLFVGDLPLDEDEKLRERGGETKIARAQHPHRGKTPF